MGNSSVLYGLKAKKVEILVLSFLTVLMATVTFMMYSKLLIPLVKTEKCL
jgi:hypothetical protein